MLPTMAEKTVDKNWTRGSGHEGPSFYSGMENHVMVAELKHMEHEEGSNKRDKMETQIRVSQQRCAVGYSDVEERGRTGYSS